MNSERPPESASSTPTGPRGSEGLREGLGYFLFEFWRPFKHVTCVPVPVPSTDNMLAQQAAPTAARGGGKAAKHGHPKQSWALKSEQPGSQSKL